MTLWRHTGGNGEPFRPVKTHDRGALEALIDAMYSEAPEQGEVNRSATDVLDYLWDAGWLVVRFEGSAS